MRSWIPIATFTTTEAFVESTTGLIFQSHILSFSSFIASFTRKEVSNISIFRVGARAQRFNASIQTGCPGFITLNAVSFGYVLDHVQVIYLGCRPSALSLIRSHGLHCPLKIIIALLFIRFWYNTRSSILMLFCVGLEHRKLAVRISK